MPAWNDIKPNYRSIIYTASYDDRIAAISGFLADRGLGPIPCYSKDDWIGTALDRQDNEVVLKSDFQSSHWFKFHQAAKAQLAHVMDLTKDL